MAAIMITVSIAAIGIPSGAKALISPLGSSVPLGYGGSPISSMPVIFVRNA
jgi:hypothetical protein